MGKFISAALCLAFLWGNLAAQNYRVQIAVYDQKVNPDFFDSQGLTDVVQELDINGFFRYYVKMRLATLSEAIQIQEFVISKGFDFAQILDLEQLKRECASPCAKGVFYDGLVVGVIFFDFDKSYLRNKSKKELEALHQIMIENTHFNVVIMAHTDSKGSIEYNKYLSNKRAIRAREYLIAKGIYPARIQIEEWGETTPIAKNVTPDGEDLPEGRQYNRRIEFVLKDNGQVRNDLVENVRVPDYLKIE